MRVVITEKPSVARDLAAVLGANIRRDGWLEGDGLKITWCLGHLVELEEPAHYDPSWKRWTLDALPMLPEDFDVKLRADAAERFAVIRRLVEDRDVDDIVNACDAGREGELIFRYVLQLTGAQRPVRRLWLASLTTRAIREAWGRLRDGHDFDPLADAARCRSEADWLVGLNATRGMTCLARKGGGGRVLSVGRVQTPTLAMVVERDRAIEAFVPETTWQVRATFEADTDAEGGRGRWVGTWFRSAPEPTGPRAGASGKPTDKPDEDEAPPAERLPSAEAAAALADAVRGRPGTIETAETKRITDRPPLLYDLTSLQRRANQRYGLSAQRTLEVAQALYERHKLITYPRTDARYLTPDQVDELPGLAEGLAEMSVYRPHAQAVVARFAGGYRPDRRVVDASEVGDHHAILPTGRRADDLGLSADEKRVFDLVARRFLAALSEDALFDRTTLVVAVDAPVPEGLDAPPRFRARGRVCVREGWRAVDPPKRSREVDLPRVSAGALADTVDSEVVEGQTRPPRHHDDASLLRAMETAGRTLDDAALRRAMRSAGLGTPATRAAILQTLLDRRFIVRRGRQIHATEGGRALIDAIPAPELKSAELTGRWEARLADIAEGRADRPSFMRDVEAHVREIIGAITRAEPPTSPAFAAPEPDGKPLGACPRCGGAVLERQPVYGCSGCELVVYKTMAGRAISRRMVGQLLKDGRTEAVKGFKSKRTGKAFSAGLEIRDDGTVGLWFPEDAPVGACPRCGAPVRARGKVWGCSGDDCDVHVFREMSGRKLDDVIGALLKQQRTPVLEGFTSRTKGTTFSAAIRLDESGKAVFDFQGDAAPAAAPSAGPVPVAVDAAAPADPAGMACPACGEGRLLRGRTAWGCSRWREGCRWTLRYDAVQDSAEAVERVRSAQ